jgi:hypothetical protein
LDYWQSVGDPLEDLTLWRGSYLYVSDVAASMHWYCQVLGLMGQPCPRKPPFAFANLRSANLDMVFILTDPATDLCRDAHAPVGRIEPEWVNLGVHDVESLYKRVSERVTIHTTLSLGPRGSLRFAIEDPDWHMLMFHQAPEGW